MGTTNDGPSDVTLTTDLVNPLSVGSVFVKFESDRMKITLSYCGYKQNADRPTDKLMDRATDTMITVWLMPVGGALIIAFVEGTIFWGWDDVRCLKGSEWL